MPKYLSGPTPFGIKIVNAEGSILYGEDGKEYIDLLGGWCVATVGWKHPRMVKALQENQPGYYLPPTIYNDISEQYAEKLLATLPSNLTHVFRVTSGSEAVEFAIKLARSATGKKKIISFGEVYHGHTFAAASIGIAITPAMEPGVGEIVKLNLPNEYKNKHGLQGEALSTKVLDEIESVMKQGNVAAFISEAIFTNVGTVVPPKDFYPRLQELCKKYEALLIIDEVASGFGRTGRMYAFEHYNVMPDIITLGKGLTGGYSTAGAAICTTAVEAQSHKIPLYSTFGWNLYDLVAMEENLNIIREEKLVERSATVGETILRLLKPLEDLPKVAQVRGIGMLFSIEFVTDKVSRKPAELADAIMKEGFTEGIIIETADDHTLFFSPSLNIPEEIAKKGIEKLTKIIRGHCA